MRPVEPRAREARAGRRVPGRRQWGLRFPGFRPTGSWAAAAVVCWSALQLSATSPAQALETDQYLTWGHDLSDSTERVNDLLNREIAAALERINRRQPPIIDCRQVPERVFFHLFPGLMVPRFRELVRDDSQVELFPGDMGYRQYLKMSIYREPAFPYLLPMAHTIQIDNVRFGLDKLGHLFGFGRRYYVRYQRARSRGLSEEDAMRKVIGWGLRLERVLVGGLSDGIFSYADLEANFQGLRLALDFCRPEEPYVRRDRGRWRLERQVDLRDYINPRFDEAYYNNHHSKRRWRKVKPILEREYCPLRNEPEIQAMLRDYRERDAPNLSQELIARHFAARGQDLQRRQSLESICRSADSTLDTPALPSASTIAH